MSKPAEDLPLSETRKAKVTLTHTFVVDVRREEGDTWYQAALETALGLPLNDAEESDDDVEWID